MDWKERGRNEPAGLGLGNGFKKSMTQPEREASGLPKNEAASCMPSDVERFSRALSRAQGKGQGCGTFCVTEKEDRKTWTSCLCTSVMGRWLSLDGPAVGWGSVGGRTQTFHSVLIDTFYI